MEKNNPQSHCKINGRIEDMSELQGMLNNKICSYVDIAKFMLNKHSMDGVAALFFGEYVLENGIPEDFDEVQRLKAIEVANRPNSMVHCKYCNSINVRKLGPFEQLAWQCIGKEWHCNNCNSDF